jgi:hypothetical protein
MLTTAQIHEFTFLCNCPVGTFFRDVERTFGKKSSFIDHMTQSRIEVLKGIRSLVDERVRTRITETNNFTKRRDSIPYSLNFSF